MKIKLLTIAILTFASLKSKGQDTIYVKNLFVQNIDSSLNYYLIYGKINYDNKLILFKKENFNSDLLHKITIGNYYSIKVEDYHKKNKTPALPPCTFTIRDGNKAIWNNCGSIYLYTALGYPKEETKIN